MPKTMILKLQVMARVQVVEDDGFATTRNVMVDLTEADLSASALETIVERAVFLSESPLVAQALHARDAVAMEVV